MQTPTPPQSAPKTPNQFAGPGAFFSERPQAINAGSVGERHEKETGLLRPGLTGDGGRAAADFQKSQQMSDGAQLRRGMAKDNADQNMKEKAMRSELLQAAASNQAKIYGDMARREVSQIGLASQLQQAIMRHRNALMQALTQQ